MNVLVTGAAGFIGFHVVNRFLEQGFTVTGLDNLSAYYDPALKNGRLHAAGINTSALSANLPAKSTLSGYTFYQADLCDKDFLMQLFDNSRFDYVCHLAAQAGVRYSLEAPDAYLSANVQGFLNVLECCRAFPPRHLVYASSSSVYGLNAEIPFSTDQAADQPISLYAASKKSNELMAHAYSHLFGFPTTGLRFFTVYGPWGRPDMAIFLFTRAIFEGKPIKVFNYGNMQRDFTYVADITEGVFRVCLAPPDCSPPYKVYNIGHGQAVDLMDFIHEIELAANRQAVIETLPLQPGDMVCTWADTSGLEQAVGYKPRTTIAEGISAFVAWYRDFYRTE